MHHNAGLNLMGSAFQSKTALLHICTKSVLLEPVNNTKIVEQYHTLMFRAQIIIQNETSDLHKEETLQMTVKAINNLVRPDGVVPTLLEFGALPRRNILVLSIPFGSSETNSRVTCSGQDRNTAHWWDYKEVPGVVELGDGSQGQLIRSLACAFLLHT